MVEYKNKGFSLIELIIVVAIMAVLIALLAPQYIKYVEKSRQARDQRMADEIRKACDVLVNDEEEDLEEGIYVITLAQNKNVVVTATGVGANKTHLETYLKKVLGTDFDKTQLVSKAYQKIEITFANDGSPACNITYTDSKR